MVCMYVLCMHVYKWCCYVCYVLIDCLLLFWFNQKLCFRSFCCCLFCFFFLSMECFIILKLLECVVTLNTLTINIGFIIHYAIQFENLFIFSDNYRKLNIIFIWIGVKATQWYHLFNTNLILFYFLFTSIHLNSSTHLRLIKT